MGPKHLKATLDSVLSQLKPATGRKEALFWPFKTKDVDKLMTEIERSKSTLQLAFQFIASKLLLHAISGISTGLTSLQIAHTATKSAASALQASHVKQTNEEERRRILDWLSTMDPMLRQVDILKSQQPGTGQWLLTSDVYQAWKSGQSQTLYCPGVPGSGKIL